MQLYCPSCQAPFAAAPRCPRCGDRLITPVESFSALPYKAPPPAEIVRTTPPGRIAIGCAVALGLFIGLREVGLAIVPDLDWWLASTGIALTIGLRTIGVVAGGLLAGAGRNSGLSTGAAVGLVCGGIYLLADGATDSQALMTDGIVVAALTTVAALAGAVGCWLWPSPTELPDPDPSRAGSSLSTLVAEEVTKRTVRPTAWGRLALGLMLVIATVVGADALREVLKKGSAGLLQMGGPAHAPLVDLQLAVVGVILAGVVAGASTGAGLRHGVIVGLVGSLATLGLASANLAPVLIVVEGILDLFNLPTDGSAGNQGMLAVAGSVFVLCAIAGWFGGQLMPVLASKEQLARLPAT